MVRVEYVTKVAPDARAPVYNTRGPLTHFFWRLVEYVSTYLVFAFIVDGMAVVEFSLAE